MIACGRSVIGLEKVPSADGLRSSVDRSVPAVWRERSRFTASAREQHCPVDARLRHGPCAELACKRDARFLLRLGTLRERECSGGDREEQQRARAGEEHAKAPVPPTLLDKLAFVLDAARSDEPALQLVEVERVLGLSSRAQAEQPRPAVEVRRDPGRVHAHSRAVVDQVRVQPPAFAILLEPLLEPGPFAQQRLVRHLDQFPR